ncbi:MAG: hypothetical protein SPI53_00860 [Erysipelotrichaceae bacterium]|nr:hypothetical protein [Erysipelotrichaceae bacterium]
MKKILSFLLSLLVVFTIIPFNSIRAVEYNFTKPYDEVTYEQMKYELSEDSPFVDKYLTYGIKDGKLVRISQVDFETGEVLNITSRAVVTATIAIYIGNIFVGYLISTVINGVVIAATGKSGDAWVAEAVRYVVGKAFKNTYYIPSTKDCSIYPPNSYQYIQCMKGY